MSDRASNDSHTHRKGCQPKPHTEHKVANTLSFHPCLTYPPAALRWLRLATITRGFGLKTSEGYEDPSCA